MAYEDGGRVVPPGWSKEAFAEYRAAMVAHYGEADADRIDASLDDGVLTVRIPKPEQERPRRIDVKSG